MPTLVTVIVNTVCPPAKIRVLFATLLIINTGFVGVVGGLFTTTVAVSETEPWLLALTVAVFTYDPLATELEL